MENSLLVVKLMITNLLTSLSLTAIIMFLIKKWGGEKLKSIFLKDIENFKHELDLKKEIIKQDLNKEAQKISFLASSKQSLYPQFYEMLRKCEGVTAGLYGFRYVTDYSKLSSDDIKTEVLDSEILTSSKQEIINLLNSNRSKAIEDFQAALRSVEFFNAKKSHQEAKNFLILKTLYFSKNVSDKSFEILNLLFSIIIDVEHVKETKKSFADIEKQRKQATQLIESLELQMREEIFGKFNNE